MLRPFGWHCLNATPFGVGRSGVVAGSELGRRFVDRLLDRDDPVEAGGVEQPRQRLTAAGHGDVAAAFASASDPADQGAETSRVHERNVAQVDEQGLYVGDGAERFSKLSHGVRVEFSAGPAQGVVGGLFDVDLHAPHASFPHVPVVLIATDTDAVADEVDAAIADDTTTVVRVRAGADVARAVDTHEPDLVVLDLQIGNMGGMAVAMGLRAEANMGRLPDTAILMLLDREADIFLAKRSDVDGWLVKPIDSFRLRRASKALLAGDSYVESATVETVPATAPAE